MLAGELWVKRGFVSDVVGGLIGNPTSLPDENLCINTLVPWAVLPPGFLNTQPGFHFNYYCCNCIEDSAFVSFSPWSSFPSAPACDLFPTLWCPSPLSSPSPCQAHLRSVLYPWIRVRFMCIPGQSKPRLLYVYLLFFMFPPRVQIQLFVLGYEKQIGRQLNPSDIRRTQKCLQPRLLS